MSDWDNWQPAAPAAAIGSEVHRARAALSAGGPARSGGGGGGWQQQNNGIAAGGHADRGWGNKATTAGVPARAPAIASTSQLPRQDAATVAKRAADARMREKLQQQMEHGSSSGDRTYRERERSRERYSASAVSGSGSVSGHRERYSASNREGERTRHRDRDSRTDGKRRRSRSRSSRSPPRERERQRDRHRRDRTDEGRDVRQRRDRSEDRRSRGHSPRGKSPPRGSRNETSRSRAREQEKRVDVPPSPPPPAAVAAEEDPEADEPFSDANYSTRELEEMPRVRIANIVAGTTILDMMSTFEDYGTILQCIRTEGGAKSNALQTFEITYKRAEDAEKACKTMHGVSADGAIIDVTLVNKKKKLPSPPPKEPTPEPQELPGSEIADVVEAAPAPVMQPVEEPAAAAAAAAAPALASSGAASLLSRISGPVPVSTKAVNGKKEARQKIKAPSSLEPFTELLSRAGVKDIETLRKLVRKSTLPEYVEMLAKEYPEEELLKGLTGKWALRERLEDWLGVKEKSTFDWGSRLNGSSSN